MNSRYMKRRLFETARGAIGQANINATELQGLSIPLPPLEIQRNFTGRIKQIRSIQSHATHALATAEATFQSLLHRAFAGEL